MPFDANLGDANVRYGVYHHACIILEGSRSAPAGNRLYHSLRGQSDRPDRAPAAWLGLDATRET